MSGVVYKLWSLWASLCGLNWIMRFSAFWAFVFWMNCMGVGSTDMMWV